MVIFVFCQHCYSYSYSCQHCSRATCNAIHPCKSALLLCGTARMELLAKETACQLHVRLQTYKLLKSVTPGRVRAGQLIFRLVSYAMLQYIRPCYTSTGGSRGGGHLGPPPKALSGLFFPNQRAKCMSRCASLSF